MESASQQPHLSSPPVSSAAPPAGGQIAEQPQPGRRVVRLVLLLFLLLLLSGAGFLGAIVYAGGRFPFVPEELRKNLLVFAYRIPLIPKTAEQVLIAASETEAAFTSYTPEFSLSASLGGTAISSGSLDLKIEGPVNFRPEGDVEFDVTLDVGVNFGGTLYEAKGKVRKVGTKVYGKIDSISDGLRGVTPGIGLFSLPVGRLVDHPEVKRNLDEALAQWFVYDTSGIESEARRSLESRGREQSLIESTRRNVQQFLLRGSVMPEVKKVGREVVNGESTYHLQLVPSKEVIEELVAEFYPEGERGEPDTRQVIETITSGAESVKIDAWFGVGDALLRKIVVEVQFNLGSLVGTGPGFGSPLTFSQPSPSSLLYGLAAQKLTVSTVLSLRDIGKPVAVQAPPAARTAQEYLELLQDVGKTREEREREGRMNQFRSDAQTLSAALLRHYVDKGVYPAALVDLGGMYINPVDPLFIRLEQYSYRVKANGKGYVVYVESTEAFLDAPGITPYYGFTSETTYPHQLMQKDFD